MKLLNRLLNRPVVLDFYTTNRACMDYMRPNKGIKFYPDWWKALPGEVEQHGRPASTMKRCVGFQDLYRNSLVVPMWTDTSLVVTEPEREGIAWQFPSSDFSAGVHSSHQRGDYLPSDKYQHIKLNSPWHVVCKEDVRFAFVQAVWNFDEPEKFLIPSGVLNFKYQNAIHINLMLPRTDKEEPLMLKAGQPMFHLIPLTERSVEYRFHLVTQAEYDMNIKSSLWFARQYSHEKAAMDANDAAGCPFSWRKL